MGIIKIWGWNLYHIQMECWYNNWKSRSEGKMTGCGYKWWTKSWDCRDSGWFFKRPSCFLLVSIFIDRCMVKFDLWNPQSLANYTSFRCLVNLCTVHFISGSILSRNTSTDFGLVCCSAVNNEKKEPGCKDAQIQLSFFCIKILSCEANQFSHWFPHLDLLQQLLDFFVDSCILLVSNTSAYMHINI